MKNGSVNDPLPIGSRGSHALSGEFKVHSSETSDFLAPIARSKRSVVARSAAIPFSSCPTDLNPLVDRGSCSISRSIFFRRHSWIAFQNIVSSHGLEMAAYTNPTRLDARQSALPD